MGKRTRKKIDLEPLKITCTSTDCDAGLHCFRKSREMAEADRGRCRSCGEDLIDWGRVHTRNPADAAFTFEALRQEMVRHHFWHEPLDQWAINHARRKGMVALRQAARRRLETSVGSAKPARDGRQTPQEKNVIFYAQHALACCCRKCMEYWHGITLDQELSGEQVEYFVDLVMMYVAERMPNLQDEGEKVPSIPRTVLNRQGRHAH